MRPNFEEPLDTAKQLVEKNITLYFTQAQGPEAFKQWLLESPIPEYNIFGENMIITDDYDHYADITKHGLMGAGTHAFLSYYLGGTEYEMGDEY